MVGVSQLVPPSTIFAQLLKALEAEEKRISPSRALSCIEKAQTRVLPFSENLGTLLSLFQLVDRDKDRIMGCPRDPPNSPVNALFGPLPVFKTFHILQPFRPGPHVAMVFSMSA